MTPAAMGSFGRGRGRSPSNWKDNRDSQAPTHRSYAAAAGKATPKQWQGSGDGSTPNSSARTINKSRERVSYVCTSLVGQVVRVERSSGDIVEGLLFTCKPTPQGLAVILKFARKVTEGSIEDGPFDRLRGEYVDQLRLDGREVLQVYARDVTWASELTRKRNGVVVKKSHGFKTDVEISHREFKERELVKWAPTEGEEHLEIGFEGHATASNKEWDQFSVNERLYGVKTTFKEELYTTELDKSSEFYKKKVKEAERLAAEIEGKSYEKEVEGLDEEQLYGAVLRPDETKASADTGKVNGAEPTKKAAEPSPKQPSVAPPKKQRAAAEEVEVKKEVKSVQEPATQKKSEAPPVEVKKSAESAAAVATPAIEAKEAAEAQGEEASESSKADLKQKIAKKLNPKAKVFKPKAATAPAGSIPPVHAGMMPHQMHMHPDFGYGVSMPPMPMMHMPMHYQMNPPMPGFVMPGAAMDPSMQAQMHQHMHAGMGQMHGGETPQWKQH